MDRKNAKETSICGAISCPFNVLQAVVGRHRPAGGQVQAENRLVERNLAEGQSSEAAGRRSLIEDSVVADQRKFEAWRIPCYPNRADN